MTVKMTVIVKRGLFLSIHIVVYIVRRGRDSTTYMSYIYIYIYVCMYNSNNYGFRTKSTMAVLDRYICLLLVQNCISLFLWTNSVCLNMPT